MHLYNFRMNPFTLATILGGSACVLVATPASADAPATVESAPPTPAKNRAEFTGAIGAAGGASSWRGDPVAFSSLKLGFRFWNVLAPYFLSRLGYGEVNDRSVLSLQLGVEGSVQVGRVRPYARLGILHQHEESMAAVRADTGGALFGVGDGIRHRSGPEGALGASFSLHKDRKQRFELVAFAEGIGEYFPDPRGPGTYFMGSVGLGVDLGL